MGYIFVREEPWNIPHAGLIWRRAIAVCCPALQQNIGGRKFKDQCEVGADKIRCLVTQGTEWYQQGLEKPVPRCDKCLSFGEDYVENRWDGSTFNFYLLVLENNTR